MDSEINIIEPLLVFSKKYYAGGEVVVELITPDNKELNTNINITFKKGEGFQIFQLGKKYIATFTQINEKGED